MALTDRQKADVRRYAGYPMVSDTPTDDSRDFAYSWVSPGTWRTLFHRLNHMTAEEEQILIDVYLTNLASLEALVVASGDDLDTDQAAVWTRNKNEIRDRTALFDGWRVRMCRFIGIAPGPMLSGGGMRVSRG